MILECQCGHEDSQHDERGCWGGWCNCHSLMPVDDKTLYTRAEMLAYGERVKDAAKDRHRLMWKTVDLAALLDEVKP
jgi:hypothetical protein